MSVQLTTDVENPMVSKLKLSKRQESTNEAVSNTSVQGASLDVLNLCYSVAINNAHHTLLDNINFHVDPVRILRRFNS